MVKKILKQVLVATALACSLSACFISDRSDEFAAYDPSKYERVAINYDVTGRGDTALVFLHDWNLNRTYWSDYTEQYKERFRVISLDLAGHGRSGRDRTQWTIESFARDVMHVLDKEGVSKVILVGHSLGADVALQFHAFRPKAVVGIVAIENFRNVEFFITNDFRGKFETDLRLFRRNFSERADQVARNSIRSKNRDVINRIVTDYKTADPKISLAVYKSMVPGHEQEKEKLQELPFRIQIIASDYQPIDEEALKKYAKAGYEIEWVEGAGHFPMVEQPDLFRRALERSLFRIESSGALASQTPLY